MDIHKLSIRMDKATEETMNRCKQQTGLKISTMLRMMIDDYLNNVKKEPEKEKEDNSTMYNIRITNEQYKTLMARSAQDGVSAAEVIRRAVRAWAIDNLEQSPSGTDCPSASEMGVDCSCHQGK